MNESLIEIVYEYLLKLKGSASFEEIWKKISSKYKLDTNNQKNEIIADLYSDLVLDNRFALTSEGKWGLRQHLKSEDVKKQYDYIDNFETTEEFDDFNDASDTLELNDDLQSDDINLDDDLEEDEY
ncbi:DNA-directed RNA polymerase subunit delta [Spiroplasma endosymbiont of Crioceris asparagi]|uniref:DNA-directed RNA polymerase subunit delta n=1 Tax=Spiroplasma endosymbiont of Crioceris asparagi TaxID=3066286 RepID=UPI0030CD1279